MVNENNTQWNNDYTLDETLSIDSDETYGYDDEAEAEDFQSEEIRNNTKNGKSKIIIQLILVVLLVIIIVCSFVLYKHLGKNEDNEQISDNTTSVNTGSENDAFFNENMNIEEDYNMLNVDFNNNNGNQDKVVNTGIENSLEKNVENSLEENIMKPEQDINKESEETEDVVVSWDSNMRQNPFKPIQVEEKPDENYESYGDLQFEIIEPPTKLVPDDNLTRLLQTQISGILYDEASPSAIIKLGGQDQFVKVGDVISGYRIKKITKNKVEISYKHNTYIASVGELFTRGKLGNESGIVNLNNKFAGRYREENIEE